MNADTFLRKWFQPWPFGYLFKALRIWNSKMAWKSSKAHNIKFGSLCVDKCIIWSPGWRFRFQFWSIYVPSWMFYWNWRIYNLNQNHFKKKWRINLPFLHIYFQSERHQFDWSQWQNMYGNHMERSEVLLNSNLEYTVMKDHQKDAPRLQSMG